MTGSTAEFTAPPPTAPSILSRATGRHGSRLPARSVSGRLFHSAELGVLYRRDLDFGASSPVWFAWRNRHLLASGSRRPCCTCSTRISSAAEITRPPLFSSPKLGNDARAVCRSRGLWGGFHRSRRAGRCLVYVPMEVLRTALAPIPGHRDHDARQRHGVQSGADARTQNPVLEPAWISAISMVPDPVVIANGVVFGWPPARTSSQKWSAERLVRTRNRAS